MATKILHISDLHFEAQPETLYPGVNQHLRVAAELLAAEHPDLIIVSGDLTSHGSRNRKELEMARDWLLRLDAPVLAVPGNHDLGANPLRGQEYPETEAYEFLALRKTNYGSVFSPEPVTMHDLPTVAVIGIALREEDPDGALPRLESTLDSVTKPVILVGHYPLAPTRATGPLATFAFHEFIPHTASRLRRVIASHPVVRLYAAGHVHACTAQPLAPHCLQVTAGGLGPGPSLYRVYTISGAQLHFETRFGTGPLGFWEQLVPEFDYAPEYHLGHHHERNGQQTLY
ncbi:MAG: metallophosphoesterase [Thermaerobacter sp.]|nr:metallophosphoesterase [Thermaerobacter sp.]